MSTREIDKKILLNLKMLSLNNYVKEMVSSTTSPRTPQKNGIVQRKNRTLQQMARTVLYEKSLPKYLWEKVIQSYPQEHWIEDSKKIGPEMQEKALGFS